ncbi:hypothetical protein JW911_03325 [Candidatus Peregrinibacteria bacterium]|nr:hypothetical protein [Candidatus Peregrinibacteria bacterium]
MQRELQTGGAKPLEGPAAGNCSDGADNDGDGLTDCADPDCTADPACTLPGVEICTNGLDDDGDGLIDCADPNCASQSCGNGCLCSGGSRTETNCTDGLDNDGDGQTDCADSNCFGNPACAGSEICNDGVDNDGDTYRDCVDADCQGFARCSLWTNPCNAGSNAGTPCLTGAPLGTCYNGKCTQWVDTNGDRICQPDNVTCY